MQRSDNVQKCSFVAVIGAPNAGKSTLINQMVGAKVTIATPKAQTTRNRVMGIVMSGDTQIVMIDTPGVFKAKERFDKSMVNAAWRAVEQSDSVCVIIDATNKRLSNSIQMILSYLEKREIKAVAVINKIDAVKKPDLLSLAAQISEFSIFEKIFMVSAKNGDGVEDLKLYLAEKSNEISWVYPEDQLTDISSKMLAAEITREKILMRLRQELPYGVFIETESWDETEKSITIHQVVYVEKDTHKVIIIGKGGAKLKEIGTAARFDMQNVFDKKIHLYLHIKVKEDWKQRPEFYSAIGLEM